MTPERLREGTYWLGERLYGEEATRRRREAFFHQWRGRSPT
jgi:hypothetical protein